MNPVDVKAQADALKAASEASPVRQYRDELRKRAREWARAASDLEEAAGEGEDGAVELVGSVTMGMVVWRPHHSGENWMPVVRVLSRDSQTSLHLESPDGRAEYVNLWGNSSPVVVRA